MGGFSFSLYRQTVFLSPRILVGWWFVRDCFHLVWVWVCFTLFPFKMEGSHCEEVEVRRMREVNCVRVVVEMSGHLSDGAAGRERVKERES